MTSKEALNIIKNAVAAESARCLRAGDTEAGADLISTLITGLAMTIAMQCRGDSRAINDFAEGSSQYLFDECARFQKFGAALAPTAYHAPGRKA